MNGLRKRGKHLIFYLFNGLIFVFDGKKSRFFDDLGLLVVRWGRREWPIMGPAEINDFRRCVKVHSWKFHTVLEV
jgi:hypothetical protein